MIDVGCLQVNLHHHPHAFASLDKAFDPAANARYAARFVARLHRSAQNWETAAAHYHSHTPERADAYLLKVMAAWPGMAQRLAAERRRDALVAAWARDIRRYPRRLPAAIGAEGFQAFALSFEQRSWWHHEEATGRATGRTGAYPLPAPHGRADSRRSARLQHVFPRHSDRR